MRGQVPSLFAPGRFPFFTIPSIFSHPIHPSLDTRNLRLQRNQYSAKRNSTGRQRSRKAELPRSPIKWKKSPAFCNIIPYRIFPKTKWLRPAPTESTAYREPRGQSEKFYSSQGVYLTIFNFPLFDLIFKVNFAPRECFFEKFFSGQIDHKTRCSNRQR